jgi:hypothetical protein
MTNHADITNLLKSFSGQARILTIPRAYIDMLGGDHLAALLLSQAVFLSDRAADDDGWFAKSYADWTAELGLSERQIRRVVDLLRPFGLETKLRRSSDHEMAATLHYRVDMSTLTQTVLRFCRSRSDETSERRSDETSERSYSDESKRRESDPPSALSENEDGLPDFVPPATRKIITLTPQPDGGAKAYTLVEAYCDAWGVTIPKYRDQWHRTQRKGAESLANLGAAPDDVRAMIAERRAKGKQPDECPMAYLASDYVGWKSRNAVQPTVAGSFWGRDLTDGE